MHLVVTRSSDGTVVSRVSAEDPTNGDTAEVRTDGRMIEWTAMIGGEPVEGSAAVSELLDLDEPESPACLNPIAALICLGAAAALLAGCGYGFSCEGGGVPGGAEGEGDPEDDDDTGD